MLVSLSGRELRDGEYIVRDVLGHGGMANVYRAYSKSLETDLALKVLALGGVFVAGGIAVKILEKMKDGTFFKAFQDKWNFESLLTNIPVSIVLNESAPLLGAAYEALAATEK